MSNSLYTIRKPGGRYAWRVDVRGWQKAISEKRKADYTVGSGHKIYNIDGYDVTRELLARKRALR